MANPAGLPAPAARRRARVPAAGSRDFSDVAEAAPRPDPEDGAIVARSPGWVVDVEV